LNKDKFFRYFNS